jgi:hypothetical protein
MVQAVQDLPPERPCPQRTTEPDEQDPKQYFVGIRMVVYHSFILLLLDK